MDPFLIKIGQHFHIEDGVDLLLKKIVKLVPISSSSNTIKETTLDSQLKIMMI